MHIPAWMMAAARHTHAVEPDLALWRFPLPDREVLSYDFRQTGPPWLILEVVSHSSGEVRDNDWIDKFATYARMGVGEYWLLDTKKPWAPLQAFGLPAAGATEYVRLPAVADGWRSAVLGAALRWDADREELQRWDDARGTWHDIYVPPAVAEVRGWNEGRKDFAVQSLVQVVERHGALSREQLEAYGEQLEARSARSLPDAVRIGERLVAFAAGESREQAVQTFVDTGCVPTPTDTPG